MTEENTTPQVKGSVEGLTLLVKGSVEDTTPLNPDLSGKSKQANIIAAVTEEIERHKKNSAQQEIAGCSHALVAEDFAASTKILKQFLKD